MEDEIPAPPDRRRLWVAVVATMVAAPLLVLDNLTADPGDASGTEAPATRPVATVVVPHDRPETGPVKGISVVTPSTTSSTVPLTLATTTTRR